MISNNQAVAQVSSAYVSDAALELQNIDEGWMTDFPSTAQKMPRRKSFDEWAIANLGDANLDALTVDQIQRLFGSVNSREKVFDISDYPYKTIFKSSSVFCDVLSAQGNESEDVPKDGISWFQAIGHRLISVIGCKNSKQKPQENPKRSSYTGNALNPIVSADREAGRIEAMIFAKNLTFREQATTFGIINQLAFHRGESMGVFEWEEGAADSECDRHLKGVKRKEMAAMATANVSQSTALSSTVASVNRYFKELGAYTSRTNISKAIAKMKEMGLVDYHSEIEPGVRGQSRVYTFIDVPRLLLLAEALEREMTSAMVCETEEGWACTEEGYKMPGHMGHSLKLMHEQLIPGFGYLRTGDGDMLEPDDWPSTDAYRKVACDRRTASKVYALESLIEDLARHTKEFGLRHFNTASVRRKIRKLLDRVPDLWRFYDCSVEQFIF